MKVDQCNRNPFFLADFAYDGRFSDGEKFSLRIPEEDVGENPVTTPIVGVALFCNSSEID